MSEIAKRVGLRIRNYRTQLGYSQEKLAELSGCHPTYIGQVERGEKNATLESVEKIPTALNISLSMLFEKLDKLTNGDTLILSGSIPSSLPADIYEQIMGKLENRNIRFVVDASGKLLVNSLKYKPFMIKPNKAELSEIFGKTLENEEEIISCAAKLQKLGALNVLVTLGADGAILLNENGEIIRKPAHKIQAVNTVGAGDSMVAGFIAGIDKGSDYALNLGRACASATTTEMGLASYQKIIEFMK